MANETSILRSDIAILRSDIAILRNDMTRVGERLYSLEENIIAHEAILNKSWGGALVIFLFGSIIGGIVAFWSNIQKMFGH